MTNIVFSAGVRQNVSAPQPTSNLTTVAQNRIAAGRTANAHAVSFASCGVQDRAGDFSALLDAISNGIRTLQAAGNGLTSIIKTLQSMQATLLQARQDRSYTTETYHIASRLGPTAYLGFSGGSVGAAPVRIPLVTAIRATPTAATSATRTTDAHSIVVAGGTPVAKTVDQIVNDINASAALQDRVRASTDNSRIRITNLATGDLTVAGFGVDGHIDGGDGTRIIAGNQVRASFAARYNELRDELDRIISDASCDGIDLLGGGTLRMILNESANSTIDVQARDPNGNLCKSDAVHLNISPLKASDLDFDLSIDRLFGVLAQALSTARSQAATFVSCLSILENRQSFVRSLSNTLRSGAGNLTLADTGEEGANMLALQSRQQRSTAALSLAAQADQGVLRLFG